MHLFLTVLHKINLKNVPVRSRALKKKKFKKISDILYIIILPYQLPFSKSSILYKIFRFNFFHLLLYYRMYHMLEVWLLIFPIFAYVVHFMMLFYNSFYFLYNLPLRIVQEMQLYIWQKINIWHFLKVDLL